MNWSHSSTSIFIYLSFLLKRKKGETVNVCISINIVSLLNGYNTLTVSGDMFPVYVS